MFSGIGQSRSSVRQKKDRGAVCRYRADLRSPSMSFYVSGHLRMNVNPVVIRRLLQQLKKAGLVNVKRGSGGADTERPLDQITLLDVYNAVECVEEGKLFHFHEDPNPRCPVGKNIHALLDVRLEEIQEAMEREMRSVSIQNIMDDAEKFIQV